MNRTNQNFKLKNSNNFLKLSILAIIISCMFFTNGSATACTLASHDWQLVAHFKLNTGTPIFPLSEADLLLTNDYEPVDKVFWINQNAKSSSKEIIKAIFVPFYQSILSSLPLDAYIASGLPNVLYGKDLSAFDWTKKINILPITSGSELTNYINPKSDESYIVLGSDNYVVRFALYADANANYNCYQLVILQEGRMRAVQANSTRPSAKEAKGLAYISFIFYGNPFKGQFMSFSVHPIANTRLFFIQNEELVARLLFEEKLLPRLSMENDPSSYDIPELPE